MTSPGFGWCSMWMNFSPGGECKPSPGLPMASLCWTAQISQAVETPAGRFVFLGSGKKERWKLSGFVGWWMVEVSRNQASSNWPTRNFQSGIDWRTHTPCGWYLTPLTFEFHGQGLKFRCGSWRFFLGAGKSPCIAGAELSVSTPWGPHFGTSWLSLPNESKDHSRQPCYHPSNKLTTRAVHQNASRILPSRWWILLRVMFFLDICGSFSGHMFGLILGCHLEFYTQTKIDLFREELSSNPQQDLDKVQRSTLLVGSLLGGLWTFLGLWGIVCLQTNLYVIHDQSEMSSTAGAEVCQT